MFNPTELILCGHCGNKTPHAQQFAYRHTVLVDETEDGQKFYDDYDWVAYVCATCGSLSLFGKFDHENVEGMEKYKLYPKGSSLLPPSHMMSPAQPIPKKIYALYEEVWPLRHRSPSAFIGQVRRLLEYICKDKKASGADLFSKLKDLVSKGIFPGYFKEITDLMRKVGNLGAHASDAELSIWDAELIDEFFRSVLEYVYIALAKIKRMEERIKE
jgi:hypothetical protein